MSKFQPFQNEFRKELIKRLISQVLKGETAALIGLPGVGKTNAVYWIKKKAESKSSNISMIHIDLNNLVGAEDLSFFRLLLLELYQTIPQQIENKRLTSVIKKAFEQNIHSKDELLTFDAIKRITQETLNSTNRIVCFLFDSFEKLEDMSKATFDSITAIRNMNKTRIVNIFVGNKDLATIFPPEKTGDLYNLLNYNKHWLRLLTKEESFKLIEEFTMLLDDTITRKEKERIWELSGGHSWYIKVLTKIFKEEAINPETPLDKVYSLTSIQSRADQIWTSLSEKYREIILNIVLKNHIDDDDIPEFLIKTGMIKKIKEGMKFFSPLFSRYLEKKAQANGYNNKSAIEKFPKKKEGLSIDLERRTILRKGKSVNTTFTKGEFNLLKYLFENESLALTRDDIAEVLWGKDSTEKYSDWAIDKTISRLREKIEDNPRKPKHLLTMRGIGFKFISS